MNPMTPATIPHYRGQIYADVGTRACQTVSIYVVDHDAVKLSDVSLTCVRVCGFICVVKCCRLLTVDRDANTPAIDYRRETGHVLRPVSIQRNGRMQRKALAYVSYATAISGVHSCVVAFVASAALRWMETGLHSQPPHEQCVLYTAWHIKCGTCMRCADIS